MDYTKAIKKLLKLPVAFESIWVLTLAAVLIAILPHRRIVNIFGEEGGKATFDVSEKDQNRAKTIGRVIVKISRFLPWNCTCMQKALAACLMLSYRRIPSTLYIGVRKDKAYKVQAHAWLCCAQNTITGAKEKDSYQELSSFVRF